MRAFFTFKSLACSVAIILISCGDGTDMIPTVDRPPQIVYFDRPSMPDDAEIRMITEEFYGDAKALGYKVDKNVQSIEFVEKFEDAESTVGRCINLVIMETNQQVKRIKIVKSFWEGASSLTKRALMFHELGHCALNLEHAEADAEAIMKPTVLGDKVIYKNWFKLVKEMFASSKLGLVEQTPN